MTIALTGHRPNKLRGEYLEKYVPNRMYQQYGPLSKALFHELQTLITMYEPTSIISGLALGADQIWAHVGLQMGIPVIGAIPFKGQENKWSGPNKLWYQYLLEHCKPVYVCNPGHANWKMQKRNEWMVNNADRLVAVWNGDKEGGTYNCVQYAEGRIPISYINPADVPLESYL
jgi:uncharacterized phage-like protein YoqJ